MVGHAVPVLSLGLQPCLLVSLSVSVLTLARMRHLRTDQLVEVHVRIHKRRSWRFEPFTVMWSLWSCIIHTGNALHLYIKSLTLTNNILSKYVFCARRQGRCKLSSPGQPCEVGLRRRHYYILGGSVLGVWTHLEGVLGRHSSHNSRMQIARVQTLWKRLVGESVTVGIVLFVWEKEVCRLYRFEDLLVMHIVLQLFSGLTIMRS